MTLAFGSPDEGMHHYHRNSQQMASPPLFGMQSSSRARGCESKSTENGRPGIRYDRANSGDRIGGTYRRWITASVCESPQHGSTHALIHQSSKTRLSHSMNQSVPRFTCLECSSLVAEHPCQLMAAPSHSHRSQLVQDLLVRYRSVMFIKLHPIVERVMKPQPLHMPHSESVPYPLLFHS